MADHPQPELIMGTHPDSSPWVISARWSDTEVRVNGYGRIRFGMDALTPAGARRHAYALLAAADWVDTGRSAQVEAGHGTEEASTDVR